MAWIQPKTNWAVSDRFNISDYNRIKGNLDFLKDKAETLYMSFDTRDMGQEKTKIFLLKILATDRHLYQMVYLLHTMS